MRKLAICIPNYNKYELFFRLLKQSIKQIERSRYENEIEICISDDASPKDITDEINDIIVENPDICIKYQRLRTNKGRWGNIKEVISMCDAEYCWVIGNDDIYAQRYAVDTIFKKLFNDSLDILTFPTILFDGEEYRQHYQLTQGIVNKRLDLTDSCDFEEWFAKCEYWLNFFSDPMLVVFKKALWEKYVNDVELEDNGFGFWIVLSVIALKGGIIQYIEQFFIVRDYSDDSKNFADCKFSYIYLRDCLLMWKYLSQINKKAAQIFDVCTFQWYYENYQNLMQSTNLTNSHKQYIISNATDMFKLLEKSFLPDDKLEDLKCRKVLLFGAGFVGVKIKQKLDSYNIAVSYYVDNNKEKQGNIVDKIEIISIEKSLEITDGIYIISTITGASFLSIYKQLIKAGIKGVNIILIDYKIKYETLNINC